MTDKPHYITSVEIARYLEVVPSAVTNWLTRFPSAPEPDATYVSKGRVAPLWLESRLPEWAEWRLNTVAPKWMQRLVAAAENKEDKDD